MKMYIEPIGKPALEKYLQVPDLTQSAGPHAVRQLYETIEECVRETHPQSEVIVYRESPIVAAQDNYDRLLIPKDNISRSSTYTHYVDAERVLRTHTTAHVPGILRDLAGRDDWRDVVIVLPGLAYRRDVTDKTHLGVLHQLEMWRVVRNRGGQAVTKHDLMGVIEGVAGVAAPGWKLRIVDMLHPYTKQGMEVNVVKGGRDIEILECGLINDRILENAGLDPKTHSGWAMGMGLDRLVMTLKGIPDIRYLRSTNAAIAGQMADLAPYHEVSHQPAIRRDMSYSVPDEYVEEDIHEDIRQALGDDVEVLESVQVLSEAGHDELPENIRERLGIRAGQKNVLVRITLRHLERTLTNAEANGIYDQVYVRINHGTGGYV